MVRKEKGGSNYQEVASFFMKDVEKRDFKKLRKYRLLPPWHGSLA